MDCTTKQTLIQIVMAENPGIALDTAFSITVSNNLRAIQAFLELPAYYRNLDSRDAWAFAIEEVAREASA